jgi:hypothetical protein
VDVPTPARRTLEELWRLRLKNAESRYAHTREQLRNVLRTLPHGEIPSPDGSYAYQQALHAENIALLECTRVLRVFTDLVVHGKIPEED